MRVDCAGVVTKRVESIGREGDAPSPLVPHPVFLARSVRQFSALWQNTMESLAGQTLQNPSRPFPCLESNKEYLLSPATAAAAAASNHNKK